MKLHKSLLFVLLSAFIIACTDYEERQTSKTNTEPASVSLGASDSERIDESSLPQTQLSSKDALIEDAASNDETSNSLEPKPDKVVDPSVVSLNAGTEGYLEWEAPQEVAYSSAEVIVVGADGARRKYQFQPGQAMSVNEALPDGLYHWESTVTPQIDDRVLQEMRAIRASGNLEEQEKKLAEYRAMGLIPTEEEARNNRQSGGFVVRDGVTTPTTTEVTDEGDVL